jgi:uncharacterized membrane protein YphA (DoxX/SURF4 family)
MKTQMGRHVFGGAVILYGILFLYWRDSSIWLQVQPFGKIPHPEMLASLAGAIEILGGFALQWRKTARIGAVALSAILLLFTLLWIPALVAHRAAFPYDGNFFMQLSQFSGAFIVLTTLGASDSRRMALAARLGYWFFGVSVVSLTWGQIYYFSPTVALVPKWIPPSQMFWAIATTVAFGLAAIALLSGRLALLGSRLLTAMLMGFGVVVWLPLLFAGPHKLFNWTETAETFVIAGAAWIVADYLGQTRHHDQALSQQPMEI